MKYLLPLFLMAMPLAGQGQLGWAVTRGGYAPWQANDKGLHFGTGVIGGAFTVSILRELKVERPFLWTIILGIVVGFGKEIWDSRHHGSPELMDAVNTVAGFVGGAGFTYIVRF